MSSLKGIVFCLLVHIATGTTPPEGGDARLYKKGDVIIGALLSIHDHGKDKTCGKLNLFGLGFAETLIYTIDVINNSSDLLPGVTLGYDIRDYCESPTLAMKWTNEFVRNNFMINLDLGACGNQSKYTRLYQASGGSSPSSPQNQALESPIVAVVGAYDSDTTVLVAQLMQVVNVPLVSPFSTSEQLSEPYYSAFFRTVPPDGLQAKAMADLIVRFNWTYVAVVAVDHSYGRYGVAALEKEAHKRKTFCLGIIEYIPRSGFETKMENVIEKLSKRKLVRVIILWANSHQSVVFLKKAMDSGLHDKVWLISDDFATSSSDYYFRGFNNKVKGVFLGVAHHLHNDSSLSKYIKSLPSLGKRHGWWDEFLKEVFNCTSSAPRAGLPSCSKRNLNLSSSTLNNLFNPFTPFVVDAVKVIAHAMDAMYKCNDSDHPCPKTRPFIKSEDLVKYIRNASVHGITGRIWFDEKGNPKSSGYDIVNIYNQSGHFVKTKIGTWSINERLQINSSSIKWFVSEKEAPCSVCAERCSPGTWRNRMKNCCWECIPCKNGNISNVYDATRCTKCTGVLIPNGMKTACIEVTIVNVTLLSSVGIAFTIIASIGILLSFLSLLLFIKFYQTPLVKASNRELSFLLLAIIVFGFVLAIVHVVLPTDSICQLTHPWRYSIHCLCVSILFIKTIRMARAFQLEMTGLPKFCKRYVVNSKLQVIALVILNMCPVLLAILWSFLDGPHVTEEYNELPLETRVEYVCKPYQDDTGYGLKLASLCYLILLTVVCIFYSFKARNLPGNFNETRYIGLSLYILLLSWLAYFPINSALKGWYVAIISSATAALASYGLLGCIFGPKIFIILFHPEMNTNEFVRAELRSANRGTNSVSAQSN